MAKTTKVIGNKSIEANDFLLTLQRQLRNVIEIPVEQGKKRDFLIAVGNLLNEKIKTIPGRPAPDPTRRVYLTLPRTIYNSLFVSNDPTKPQKPNLQAWQVKIADQDYDNPDRRKTIDAAVLDAAVFSIRLTLSEAQEMVSFLNSKPVIGGQIKDTLRMGDSNTSGIDAFREFLNTDPNWVTPDLI